jgi:nucleotide-binding universal stress UspA family protein
MIQPPHHILVATDFGEPAEHALEYALMLAKAVGAKVTVFHAFYVPPITSGTALYVPMPIADWFRDAEKTLNAVVERARKQWKAVEALIVDGEPRTAIVAAIDAQKADLLIIGTHGRRGLARVFLGSVAERLVRTASVPVLTVTEHAPRVEPT